VSLPNLQLIAFGDLTGVVYDFARRDDILPLHKHEREDVHITIIGRGSFEVYGPPNTEWKVVAVTGQILDWEIGQWHEFKALEDNSRLINVHKYPNNKP
jgi:quercetin dioxygenase-like cupin family protein